MSAAERTREIMLGFDGSECAEHALDWAIRGAPLRGTSSALEQTQGFLVIFERRP
jgi:hypothetical protein